MRAVLWAIFIALTGLWSFPALAQIYDQTRAQTHVQTCTYDTYKWNAAQKKAVEYRRVQKPYEQILPQERDALTGCTLCQEDQVKITLNNNVSAQVCKRLAGPIEDTLNAALGRGETITSLTGYRVGMTRGKIDVQGNRTGFSNHSFGIAIDINAVQNGLYGNCFVFGPQCQLRRGGAWKPNVKGGLHEDSAIVNGLKHIGLKWGGKIKGRQKDFMHFSPSGY